jgi:uncharacterized oxidoreductase
MRIDAAALKSLTESIFLAAGCEAAEAERVAHHLVEANLTGHDSHGVIRIPTYVDWLRDGKVFAGRRPQVLFENDAIAVVDGEFGLGQSVGEEAVRIGVEKSGRHGVAVVALRNSGHLGRIGEWAVRAADAGRLSLHFVNTSGAGMLVAPHGGIDRRLSANPVAAGVPVEGAEPLILDMSACTIAEGKIRVALNRGVTVPEGCIIDSNGQPTVEPAVFYADPPGAILSIAGHKGYGLGMIAEMLAGALTGSSCTNPENGWRVVNGMLSVYLAPRFFGDVAAFSEEAQRFIDFVKSSRTVSPDGKILMPGEPERLTREQRLRDGIEIDTTTWGQLEAVCGRLGVALPSAGEAASTA